MEESKEKLLQFDGFNKRFEELMPKHGRYRDAYEAVEVEFESAFNHRKYKNYESFRVQRERRIAQKRMPRVSNQKQAA